MDLFQQFLNEQQRKVQEKMRQRPVVVPMPQPVYPVLPVVPLIGAASVPEAPSFSAAGLDIGKLREGIERNREAISHEIDTRRSRDANQGTTTRPTQPAPQTQRDSTPTISRDQWQDIQQKARAYEQEHPETPRSESVV